MSITPRFDARGLAPAIVQDADTGQVLMLAWMNAEALQRTQESGQSHFWSRSRQELWHKGATSGNTQQVVEMRIDCDQDAILLRVHPSGPACHTGQTSCFYRLLTDKRTDEENEQAELEPETEASFSVSRLFDTICQRRDNLPSGSYTTALFEKGEQEIIKKVGEEAVEVILAASAQGNQRLVEEIADLTYHLLVLLAARGLSPADIEAELARRRR
jgi:phosphoribosyl-AMP cyclohydrolase / phosphoribosyl-ATP pyrophosphohydrolase